MLSNKIILRQTKEMDRHRFYQNLRNGAREAKRTSRSRGRQSGRGPASTVEDTDRPATLPNSGRKTTRFDTSNEDDVDLDAQVKDPRYDDSYETIKLSGETRTPRQGTPVRDQSFHRTIYSPRTDRRGPSRLPSPARSRERLGDRIHDREDTWKSARGDRSRERSGERSAVDLKRVETTVEDDPPPKPALPDKESTANQLVEENRVLRMEMDDVNNQLEILKNEHDVNVQKLNEARKGMEQAERQHRIELETLKDRMRELEASKADLVYEVEAQTKKKEMIWTESERLRTELERAKGVAEHEQRTAKLREKLEKEKERLEEELERKSEQVEKLTADNALLKEQCLAAERDRGFEEELNTVKGKLDNKRQKLMAARKAAEELKKKALSPEQEAELKGKLEKLASSLKAKDLLLEEARKERRDAMREKTDVEAKSKDLKDQIVDLQAQLNSAKRVNEQLDDDKNHLERDINRLRTENKHLKEEIREEKENALKLLRFAALEEQIGPLKENIRERDAKIAALQEKIVPLKEHIQVRDLKLADLQGEIETLRHAVEGYQKQMDAIRHDPKLNSRPPPHVVVSNPVTPDHATAHRRLLDENGRLLTLLDHYRHLASQPRPVAADEGPMQFPVVPSRTPAQHTKGELLEAKKQLRSSEERVAQLEKWLDEIYNDKNFQVVTKGQGRTSLPDLPRRLVMIKGSSTVTDKKLRTGYLTDRAQ